MGRQSRTKRERRGVSPIPEHRAGSGGLLQDLVWGAGWGLFVGVVYCAFAAIVLLLKGWPDGPVLRVFSIYVGGGLLGGALLGVLRSWVRTEVRAMLLGVIIAVPIGAAFLLLMSGPFSNWGEAEIASLGFGSLFLGVTGGKVLWQQTRFDPGI